MGLRLRKYVELRENLAAENYSGPYSWADARLQALDESIIGREGGIANCAKTARPFSWELIPLSCTLSHHITDIGRMAGSFNSQRL